MVKMTACEVLCFLDLAASHGQAARLINSKRVDIDGKEVTGSTCFTSDEISAIEKVKIGKKIHVIKREQ